MRHNHVPYHKVVAARLARSKASRETLSTIKYIQIDRFMVEYERTYFELYGTDCHISYSHGWYYVTGNRYRHSTLEKSLAFMLAKLHELTYPPLGNEEQA